ncbi:MAG: caspase family protein [bacterium]
MMRVVLTLMLWLATLGVVRAEPRIALVVGNGAYQGVNPLTNPVNDAQLIADTLSGLGFEVTLVRDGSKAAMSQGVADFGQALRTAGPEATGLFYYAGHGVQSFGKNYLLPVDARLSNAADLDLVAVDAESVLRQMASAHNKTNIFILDACRNNPFATIPDMGDNGLAEMKAPTGTFLAYATEPRAVALDGADGHSPFTKALAAMMVSQGLPIEEMFKQVRVAVRDATSNRQTPWDTSSLTGDFTFAPVASDEEQVWAAVSVSRDPVKILLFLKAYPKTTHEAEARALAAAAMPAGAADAVPAAGEVDAETRSRIEGEDVTFTGILNVGPAEVAGSTIETLIHSSPHFSPIEGLPKEAWTDKQCMDCHKWTKQALCDQGTYYVNEKPSVARLTQHPLGGAFKLTLRQWATLGCR